MRRKLIDTAERTNRRFSMINALEKKGNCHFRFHFRSRFIQIWVIIRCHTVRRWAGDEKLEWTQSHFRPFPVWIILSKKKPNRIYFELQSTREMFEKQVSILSWPSVEQSPDLQVSLFITWNMRAIQFELMFHSNCLKTSVSNMKRTKRLTRECHPFSILNATEQPKPLSQYSITYIIE